MYLDLLLAVTKNKEHINRPAVCAVSLSEEAVARIAVLVKACRQVGSSELKADIPSELIYSWLDGVWTGHSQSAILLAPLDTNTVAPYLERDDRVSECMFEVEHLCVTADSFYLRGTDITGYEVTTEPVYISGATAHPMVYLVFAGFLRPVVDQRASEPTELSADGYSAQSIQLNHMPLIRINAPEWYKDPEWVKWLNSDTAATWHRTGQVVGECSDVFFTFDSGDGSDAPTAGPLAIPQYIWDQIARIVLELCGEDADCLIWVSNLK